MFIFFNFYSSTKPNADLFLIQYSAMFMYTSSVQYEFEITLFNLSLIFFDIFFVALSGFVCVSISNTHEKKMTVSPTIVIMLTKHGHFECVVIVNSMYDVVVFAHKQSLLRLCCMDGSIEWDLHQLFNLKQTINS